ncbi:hypothetical protein PHMEG_00018493, partial [Phytophthora megakarya]
MRYGDQECERMKAGLAVYNVELTKLWQYLDEHDRGKICSPSPQMQALLAENASLRRANSVRRQNSAEHGLNTDALILSTAGLSASGLDWELGLSPDHTGILRLLPSSSPSKGSAGEGSVAPATEISEVQSKASPSSGAPNEGSTEHSFSATKRFVRPAPQAQAPPAKRSGATGEVNIVETPCFSTARSPFCRSKKENGVYRHVFEGSVELQESSTQYLRSTGSLSPAMGSRLLPYPTLGEGEVDDDMGDDPEAEAPVGDASPRSPSISGVQAKTSPGLSQPVAAGTVPSKAVVGVLDLTSDDVTASPQKKDSSPLSSPVVSYFPRKDGHLVEYFRRVRIEDA